MNRLTIYILMICIPVILLPGCNPDVFVNRLEVSQHEFNLPMTGGSFEVSATHGDWILERIAVNRVDAYGTVFDEGGEHRFSSFCLKGLGKAIYEGEYLDFELERDALDHMTMTVSQSFDTDPRLIELFMVNDYKTQVVTVNVSPCGGYVYDRIEFGEPRNVLVDCIEERWSLVINNHSDALIEQEYPVFDADIIREINFPAHTVMSELIPEPQWFDELMKYVEAPFEVIVPDSCLSDGVLTFDDGDILEYSFGVSPFMGEMPDDVVKAAMDPGSYTLKVFWYYDTYTVDYRIWLRSEEGGMPLSFSGEMISKAFTGKWERLLLKN